MPLQQADLTRPLPYGDAQFDLIVSALALHYVEDWTMPLGEFFRLLRPGGRLVFSMHHPFMDHLFAKGENYFATYAFDDIWEIEGQEIKMRFWHRPLAAMIEAVQGAGFAIDHIAEPMPLDIARDRFPDAYASLTTTPRFIFFSASKP